MVAEEEQQEQEEEEEEEEEEVHYCLLPRPLLLLLLLHVQERSLQGSPQVAKTAHLVQLRGWQGDLIPSSSYCFPCFLSSFFLLKLGAHPSGMSSGSRSGLPVHVRAALIFLCFCSSAAAAADQEFAYMTPPRKKK